MFESFSTRARRAIFAARVDAGNRGADYMDANSLVIGLINEDQDPRSLDLNEEDPAVKEISKSGAKAVLIPPQHWKQRESFLSPAIAADVMSKLNGVLVHSKSVSKSVEIPTSPSFQRAIEVANTLQNDFHHPKVEPLHLLAAALRESCEASSLLNEAGITEEMVIKLLSNS
jgi:ATP-dependent Clp protease ATP-binding subunit ClpA